MGSSSISFDKDRWNKALENTLSFAKQTGLLDDPNIKEITTDPY